MADPRNHSRERGRRVLSRINRWVVTGAITLAGAFSVVAAETTHGKTTGSSTSTLQRASSVPTTSASGSTGSTGSTGAGGSASSTGSTGSGGSSAGIVSGGS